MSKVRKGHATQAPRGRRRQDGVLGQAVQHRRLGEQPDLIGELEVPAAAPQDLRQLKHAACTIVTADRPTHRLLATGQVPRAPRQKLELAVDPFEHRRGRKHLHPSRRKLDGEREAVESAADLDDRAGVVAREPKRRSRLARPLDEERDGWRP